MLWTFIIAVYLFNIFLIPAYMFDILGFQTMMQVFYPLRIDFVFYIALLVGVFLLVEKRDIPGWFYEGEAQNLTRVVFFITALMLLPFLADNNYIYYMRLSPHQTFSEPFWFLFLNLPIYAYQMSTLLDFIIGIAIWKFIDQWWKVPTALVALAAVYLNLMLFVLGLSQIHWLIQLPIYFFVMLGVIVAAVYATIDLRKRKYLLFKKSEQVERGWK